MVASASTANYALPLPGSGDSPDYTDLDSLATKVDAQLLIASQMGSQVRYNSLTAPVAQGVNGTAYAAITGATLLLPNDGHLYRITVAGPSYQTSITGAVRVSLGTAPGTQLKRSENTLGTTGVPYGPLSVKLEQITGSGQLLQLYVFGPATATVTVNAAADSPLELAAYRIG